jgi:uncharacterized protein
MGAAPAATPTRERLPRGLPASRAMHAGSRRRGSAIYEGTVYHRRHEPVEHAFEYRIFLPLFDLDELPHLLDPIPLWSARRRAPARFRRSDYLRERPPELPLAEAARRLVAERLGTAPAGPVRLLANPRYWGVAMNPVAFYYLHGSGPREPVEAIIAEVTNTPWGERRSYVLTPGPDGLSGEFAKQLHVSPFMPIDQSYRWRADEPGERLAVSIANHGPDGRRVFEAGLALRRREIDRRRMLRLLLGYPPMTIATAARIYAHAIRLKLKGAPYFSNPGGEGPR